MLSLISLFLPVPEISWVVDVSNVYIVISYSLLSNPLKLSSSVWSKSISLRLHCSSDKFNIEACIFFAKFILDKFILFKD